MGEAVLLACDWGTTNLRAWTLDDAGAIVAHKDFDLGVSRLKPGEAGQRFRDEVRPAFGAPDLPAILCGMIGSNLGWTEAPYADCPVGIEDLAGQLTVVDGARIVPGVRGPGISGAPDVMRGEETQLMGWLAGRPERARGLRVVCHPGTHAKWMVVEDGRLSRFVTAMTGELFSVLSRHSLLRGPDLPDDAPEDAQAFDAGVTAAGDGGALAARLFTARARVVGGEAKAESTRGYLSGLLIGADVAATPRLLGVDADTPVTLLGDTRLCGLYRRAMAGLGQACEAETFDGEAAAVAGLFVLNRMGVRP